MSQLILASTSPYRKALLARLGVPFVAAAPGVDEDAEKSRGLTPQALAQRLARLKAQALAGPGRVVIGGDQLVHFRGQILGKPGTPESARAQLRQMAGQAHELVTSVCVHADGENIEFTEVTKIHLRALTDDEIRRYVEVDQPLDCAGAYKIETLGISLMKKIESSDFTAIQGLPLIQLSQILRQKGFHLP